MVRKLCLFFGLVWCAISLGCSTTQIEPPPALPEAPQYTQVPHPTGYGIADLRALLKAPKAPDGSSLEGCGGDFDKLRTLTQSPDEVREGAQELVTLYPIDYHWCFYSRVIRLQESLLEEAALQARQKKVLDAYLFLTPIARAYHVVYQDSRYLRWLIGHYSVLSETFFYRRLQLMPKTAESLAGVAQLPLVISGQGETKTLVLEKYGLIANQRTYRKPASSPVTKTPTPEVPTAPDAGTVIQPTENPSQETDESFGEDATQ